jgi:hypothetical protein
MKLKVNSRILLAVVVTILLNGCSAPTSIWAVIVDTKGNPLPHQGVAITVTQAATTVNNATDDPTGAAQLPCKYAKYPVNITGSDGGVHKYSTVVLNADATPGTKINIVESSGTEVVKLPLRALSWNFAPLMPKGVSGFFLPEYYPIIRQTGRWRLSHLLTIQKSPSQVELRRAGYGLAGWITS